MRDVSADAQLFENYAAAKSLARSPSMLATSESSEAEMMESGTRSKRSQTFLEVIEQQRADSGIVSSKQLIGSRRMSYASQLNAPSEESEPKPAPAPLEIVEKSPFMIWINFCGLSKLSLAAFAFLYWFYPAPRLWFEQWVGLWAAKTYSQDNQFSINILAISFVGVMLVRITLDLCAFHIGAVSERNMRKAFCSTVVNAPMSFFMTENLGPLISVFSRDMAIVGEELMQDFHAGVYYMTFNIAVTVFVCTRFPEFIVVAVVIYSLLFLLQKVYSRKIVLIREEFQQAQDDVFRNLYDSLEGIEILRSAGAEQWAIDQLAESLANNRIAIVAVERTNVWLARRADFLAVCLCFATVMFVNYFTVPPAARGLIISGSMPILVLFNWSMKLLGNVQFLLNSVHRIQRYVDKVPSEDKAGHALPKHFPAKGELKFQDICLRYSPLLPLALDHVSFDLAHGAKVGVVGRTGSGKSTLLVALFRLIQPCGGNAIVDGVSVSGVTVDALRRQMAIIPQDPAMFEGTLRMNLDPYNEFTDQQVCARRVTCDV